MSQSPNRLLASLPPDEYEKVVSVLHTLRLSNGSALPHCGRTRVYFPGTGVTSILSRMSDSSTIEVASVGNEGVVGVPVLGDPLGTLTYQQVSHGTVQYMSMTVFEALCDRTALGRAVNRFCVAFMQSVMQFVACNGSHPTDSRCARWLLIAYDRIGRARFELTQPFLAAAVGAQPNELKRLMADFVRDGVLQFDAASVTVLDRIALRRRACSCHHILRRTVEMAAPPPQAHHTSLATVVPMRPATGCTLCGLTHYPHRNHSDCFRAIDAEIHMLIGRARELAKVRGRLTAEDMKKYDKFRIRRPS